MQCSATITSRPKQCNDILTYNDGESDKIGQVEAVESLGLLLCLGQRVQSDCQRGSRIDGAKHAVCYDVGVNRPSTHTYSIFTF
jgi:hypothetical protein